MQPQAVLPNETSVSVLLFQECGVYTKSSIMLGLGETDDEIIDTMLDLKVGVCYGFVRQVLLSSLGRTFFALLGMDAGVKDIEGSLPEANAHQKQMPPRATQHVSIMDSSS
eukprot:1156535-Pelagomonas_calceolata.AAC.7